ncbi:MAG: hypothetical protein K1X82_04000 [Bacteroidia bacterium]|nr:hypothetical protein [Bacteroidia bacterium]
MKKGITIFGLLAIGIIGFSSCKKCGHCEDSYGYTSSSYCSNGMVVQNTAYNLEKSSCETGGGTWVKD